MKRVIEFFIRPVDPRARIRIWNSVEASLFEGLAKRHAECLVQPLMRALRFSFEDGSEELAEVEEELADLGLQLRKERFPHLPSEESSSMIQCEGKNVFEESDLEKAEYFWFRPSGTLVTQGERMLESVEIDPDIDSAGDALRGASLPLWATLATTSFRDKALRAGLDGLVFRPVVGSDELVELWSSVEIPPVLNPLIGQDGKPPRADGSNGCWVDDLFEPWLLRFGRAEVGEMGAFDLALTRERWVIGQGMYPIKIGSKRFREWCVGQGVEAEWVPVELV